MSGRRRGARDANVYAKGYLSSLVYTTRRQKNNRLVSTLPPTLIKAGLVVSAPFVYVHKLFTMHKKSEYTPRPDSLAVLTMPSVENVKRRRVRAASTPRGFSLSGLGAVGVRVVVIALCGLMGFSTLWGLAVAPKPREITLVDGTQEVLFRTTAETAGDFFSEIGLRLEEGDTLSVAADTPVSDGMVVTVSRAFDVYLFVYNELVKLRMQEGSVGDALRLAGIEVGENDEINVGPEDPLTAGMHIEVSSYETKEITETEEIGFLIEKQYDDTLPDGHEVKDIEGVNGAKELRYRITVSNGVEVSRELIDESVIRDPVNRVVRIGTGKNVRYQTSLTGEHRLFQPRPKGDQIAKRLNMEVTAYTHTGRRTATGTRPKLGTIAVNPEQIPYGTKLYVVGYGYGVAEDTGAFRHMDDRFQIDIFMNTEEECLKWGRKRNVRVYILN